MSDIFQQKGIPHRVFTGYYDIEALNRNQLFCMLRHGPFTDEANVLFWKVIAPKSVHKNHRIPDLSS
jgi:hypothetical protein